MFIQLYRQIKLSCFPCPITKKLTPMQGFILLLLMHIFSSPAHAIGPYTTANDTVRDNGTGLQWQNNAPKTIHTWENALTYCEKLSLDDKNDWRVPNIRELKSLADYNRYYPAADPILNSHSSSSWSSTTVANDSHTDAWVVFFGNGDDIWKAKTESHHVRCVRTLSKNK